MSPTPMIAMIQKHWHGHQHQKSAMVSIMTVTMRLMKMSPRPITETWIVMGTVRLPKVRKLVQCQTDLLPMPMTVMIHAQFVSKRHQESCDGVDNTGDGTVDEINASGCVDYYQDLDGDGFGSSSSQCQCGQVEITIL